MKLWFSDPSFVDLDKALIVGQLRRYCDDRDYYQNRMAGQRSITWNQLRSRVLNITHHVHDQTRNILISIVTVSLGLP
jgi:hypothetical protein